RERVGARVPTRKEPTRHFRDAFGGPYNDKKGAKDKMTPEKFLRPIDNKVAPLVALKQNPRWRYWISRARWYNANNGLPDGEVPFWMKVNFPIKDGDREKDKDRRKDKEKG